MKRNYLVHHLIDNQASTSEEAIEFASSCPCCGITLLPTALHAVSPILSLQALPCRVQKKGDIYAY